MRWLVAHHRHPLSRVGARARIARWPGWLSERERAALGGPLDLHHDRDWLLFGPCLVFDLIIRWQCERGRSQCFLSPGCAAPHLCVHQILAFTLIQQQGAKATTTLTRCSSSLSVSTVQRRNSCGIHSGSRPSATCPPSIALSAWPYATRYETAPFHGYLTSLGSRSWQLST